MPSIWHNRWLLKGLHVIALAQAFRRYRNPRRRQSGVHLAAFYERVWRDAAAELGASYEALGGGIGEIGLDGSRIRVCENTAPIDDPVTLAVAADKALTYQLLAAQGLAVPRHAVFRFDQVGPAAAFIAARACDCVVKPAGGTGGGRGVTTGIRCPSHLARAAAAAAVYNDELLVEEQVEGDNYRLLYFDGALLDAFVRRAPSVVGDGRSSVAQLVRRANDERRRRGWGVSQVLLTVDLDMERTLAGQGLTLSSVPATGRAVRLKTVVNENQGADNATATTLLCDAIIADGARAAAAVGVRLAGIDIITREPGVPLGDSGGVILEVNTPPNYYFHYHKSDGCFRLAVAVLERLLDDARCAGGALRSHEANRP